MILTADRPAPGLVVYQPARGFRYGAEAFWLVGLALGEGVPRTAVDLGTGSGVLAWLLARHGVDVLAVDAWEGWAPAWAATQAGSRAPGEVTWRCADARELGPVGVDLVVSNPPFFVPGTGPEPAEPSKRVARFEGGATLAELVAAGVGALVPTGRAWFAVPRAREHEVITAAPAGWGAARIVRVGRSRSLVGLARGASPAVPEEVDPRGPEVASWYARATEVAP